MRNTIRSLSAALALACGFHLSIAQATGHEASLPGASAAQEWEMLPGESLRSLAKLFYPRSSHMQQRFIAATQALNRDELGAIAADQPFEQSTALRIPDLRALSAQARPRAAKARHKVAAPVPQAAAAAPQAAQPAAPVSKAEAAQLEAVAKRNQQRKAKLEDLQQRMKALEDQSRAMQQDLGKNNPNAAAPAAEAPEAAPKPRKRVVAE